MHISQGVVFETERLLHPTRAVDPVAAPSAAELQRMRSRLAESKRLGLVASSWGAINMQVPVRDELIAAGMRLCILDRVYDPLVNGSKMK